MLSNFFRYSTVEKIVEKLKIGIATACGLLPAMDLPQAKIKAPALAQAQVGPRQDHFLLTHLYTISYNLAPSPNLDPRMARDGMLSACHIRPFPGAFWRCAGQARESRSAPAGPPAKRR